MRLITDDFIKYFRVSSIALSLILTLVLSSSAQSEDTDYAKRFHVPEIIGATRDYFVWEDRDLLLIGTVSNGTYLWKESESKPKRIAQLQRSLKFFLWRKDLYIADEAGLFVWREKDDHPSKIIDQPSYSFVESFNYLLVRTGDGFYRVDHDGRSIKLAQEEHNIWSVAHHNQKVFYGNLNGLFVLDEANSDAKPRQVEFPGKAIQWLKTFGDHLLILARNDQIYVLEANSTTPKPTGTRVGFYRGSLSWNGRLIIWADNGVFQFVPEYRTDASVKSVMVSDDINVWAGIIRWEDDLVIGTNDGLYHWQSGDDRPKLVSDQTDRIESLGVWKDYLISSKTWGEMRFWQASQSQSRPFPILIEDINSIIPWRQGLLLGDSDDGAYFFDPQLWQKGQLALESIGSYRTGQRIPVVWRLNNSPYADIPELFSQSVQVLDTAGNVIQTVTVKPTDRVGPNQFQVNLDPIPVAGNYKVEVLAGNLLGAKFSTGSDLSIEKVVVPTQWSLKKFFRWQQPKDFKALLEAVSINLTVLGAVYFLILLVVYIIAPWRFVIWHEALSCNRIPFSKWFARFSLPMLIRSTRCLDAVVKHNIGRAEQLFSAHPDVASRTTWVPVPLKVGDEIHIGYARPSGMPEDQHYIAGLHEVRRTLNIDPFVLCINGAGGVGKSALAFQITRWAIEGKLLSHPVLPLMLEDTSRGLDFEALAALPFLLKMQSVSDTLGEALLQKRRVLLVLDGLSERKISEAEFRGLRGEAKSAALILTTRQPWYVPGMVSISPQALTPLHLDGVLSNYINSRYGVEYFSSVQRDALRKSLRGIMDETVSREPDNSGAQIPMLVLSLVVQQASAMVEQRPDTKLDEFPDTFNAVVEGYLKFLLRDDKDLLNTTTIVRKAAAVCVGVNFIPAPKPAQHYIDMGVDSERLESLNKQGLMICTGTTSEPLFKLALDPVAEYLAARDFLIQIRDGQIGLEDLQLKISATDATHQPSGFINAFNFCAMKSGLEYHLDCNEIAESLSP